MNRTRRLAQQLEQILLARLEEDRLRLPVLSDFAERCKGLLEPDELPEEEARSLIALDPLVVAELAKRAGPSASEPGLAGYIEQLGQDGVRQLLEDARARRVSDSRDASINERCRGIWAHSVSVAMLATELVSESGGAGGEEAYCAGLLHDVGEPIVAGFLLEAEDQLSRLGADWLSPEEWFESLGSLQRSVGLAVARHWPLPEPVRQCLESSDGYDTAAGTSVANTVRLADALARQSGPGAESGADDQALIRDGLDLLGLEQSLVERLTANLSDRVRERLDWQAVPTVQETGASPPST